MTASSGARARTHRRSANRYDRMPATCNRVPTERVEPRYHPLEKSSGFDLARNGSMSRLIAVWTQHREIEES
jgi:hypothetical protein